MPQIELNNIIDRLKANDRGALKDIFQKEYPSVCKTIHRFIRDKNLVEDLAQEVFLRLWDKRHAINITSSLSAYIRRMAINEALGYLRKHKKFDEEELTPMHTTGEDDSGEDTFLYQELEGNILEAINSLPPKCKTVFQLSRFEELTYQEIADQMEISIKTVENQMGKALKVLRAKLQNYLSLLLLLLGGWW
ncbi:MAG: RNA polymerase sigma-70 factor [Saprospiraceae bacterium]